MPSDGGQIPPEKAPEITLVDRVTPEDVEAGLSAMGRVMQAAASKLSEPQTISIVGQAYRVAFQHMATLPPPNRRRLPAEHYNHRPSWRLWQLGSAISDIGVFVRSDIADWVEAREDRILHAAFEIREAAEMSIEMIDVPEIYKGARFRVRVVGRIWKRAAREIRNYGGPF